MDVEELRLSDKFKLDISHLLQNIHRKATFLLQLSEKTLQHKKFVVIDKLIYCVPEVNLQTVKIRWNSPDVNGIFI